MKGFFSMKKTKEAYNKAVQALDLLVKQTRKAHDEAADRFEKVTAENTKWSRPVSEYDLPAKAAQAKAKADFEQCKSETFSTVIDAWDAFDRKAAEVRRALANDLSEAAVLRAADVDEKAVALLNSGLMKSRDFAQMAQDYSECPAVLALLRAAAEKYCDSIDESEGNARELYDTRHIVESVRTDGGKELEAFDNLLTAAKDLAGRVEGGFARTAQVYEKPTGLDAWESVTNGLISTEDDSGE
jgi:hypothetical protein